MSDTHKDILLKAWEQHMKLAAAFGDCCWKIRTWAIGLAGAGLGFAYKANNPEAALGVVLAMLLLFLQDAGYRRLQDQAIFRTHEIETALNDMLADEPIPRIPEDGVSTRLRTPTLRELGRLFTFKRALLWAPYLLIAVVSLGFYVSQKVIW